MKTSIIRTALLGSLLLSTLYTPQLFAADTTVAEVTDDELASEVKTALDADPELLQLKLNVVSKNKEVTINGKMTNDQQMFKAGVIAEKVAGVKYVINNMVLSQ